MTTAFTDLQQMTWRKAFDGGHRWNINYGATRSGKTYLDYYKIPRRIRQTNGGGLIVLIGNTQATVDRNLLEPMRAIWGSEFVGSINVAKNTVHLFGKRVHILGADKVSQVARLQGSSIEYAYGDEITTWNKEVFEMLKSRLDKPNSVFDGTCNPASPSHWLKKFMESDVDINAQRFTIDDNPFLTESFVENLKKEYSGTVYYDRFIRGLWVAAEGVIYRTFSDDPEAFIIDEAPMQGCIGVNIGVDFGGNKSGHAFNATAIYRDATIITIKDFYRQKIISPDQLFADFIMFVKEIKAEGWTILDCRADSAEQVLIAGMQKATIGANIRVPISNAIKGSITERMRLYNILFGRRAYKILRRCEATINAFREAVFDDKAKDDKRLDDGSTNIDNLDAQEYSTEPYHDILLHKGGKR